jgi:hypothetical protein
MLCEPLDEEFGAIYDYFPFMYTSDPEDKKIEQ